MSLRRKYGLRPGDLVITASVLLLAAAAALPFLLQAPGEMVCEITQDGALVQRVTLHSDSSDVITLTGAVHNVIEIEGKTVRFSQSDCPDQVCVRTGTLTRAGQIAVCLPNQVIVRLTGAGSEVDAVAR